VQIEPMQFSTLIAALTTGKIDLISTAMYTTSLRQGAGEFLQVGTADVETLKKDLGDVRVYDTIPDIMRDVSAGRIQAGFAHNPIVAYNLQRGTSRTCVS
jgi:polar amino acid transport system substrate-binding protein